MWQPKKFKRMEFIPLMTFLIEMYQPDVYVEIGVQKADTFNQISPLVKEAHAVDINPTPRAMTYNHVHVHTMSSLKFARQWDPEKKIDLLFIDGDHEWTAVLDDFHALANYVRPTTGLILMHDTYPGTKELGVKGYCHNAWRAARRIHRDKDVYFNWEIITLPGPYAGISILRNAQRHLHWINKQKKEK